MGSHITAARGRARAAALAVGIVAIGAALGLTPATAATAGTYSATVTPSSVVPGTFTTFTVAFTNQSAPTSALDARYLSVTVPSVFAISGVGASTPSGWTVSTSGQTVTLTTDTTNVGLLPGSTVSVPVTASTSSTALGVYTWTTQVATFGQPDPATLWQNQGTDPTVGVHSTSYSHVHCPSAQNCDSGTLSTATSTVNVDSPATNTSDSYLDTEIGGLRKLGCTVHGDVFRFNVPGRSANVTYSVTGATVESFSICWVSNEPFPTLSGKTSTFNAADGGYEGLLPIRRSKTPTNPCVVSQHESELPNEATETITTTVFTPTGDPAGSGH